MPLQTSTLLYSMFDLLVCPRAQSSVVALGLLLLTLVCSWFYL